MHMQERERGSLTLEMSIILPIFIIMFLFIYGLFGIVSAHSQITHALIQSSRSLSLDSYLLENVESASESVTKFWGGLSDMVMDFYRLDKDKHFSARTDWYASESGSSVAAKDRFVGYFTGGDEAAANEKLKNLGIVDGLDGIKFSTKIEDEDLIITIKYNLQYWFDCFGAGNIPMQQTVKARLWK